MPSADRYAKYRADQTTVWVSKAARDFLARERSGGEGTSGVLDRVIGELKKHRKANPAIAGEGRPAAKSAAKSVSKTAAKGVAKTATKSASKAAAKSGGAKSAAKKGVAKKAGAKRAAARSA